MPSVPETADRSTRVARRSVRRILPAAVFLLCGALAGCPYIRILTGPRIPAASELDYRLDADAIDWTDYTARDHLRFVVVGDIGSGTASQSRVASAMAAACVERPCDFVLVTGDLIYPAGVRPRGSRGVDPRFDRRFESVYEPMGRIDFFVVAGNHDWYTRGSTRQQVDYTRISPRWRMPGFDYAVPRLPDWISIYGLDTTSLERGVEGGQLERARDALCGAEGWRLLFGHHPVYSTGKYGGKSAAIPAIRASVGPLIRQCGVHLLFAGHDHLQSHVSTPDFEQVVQGAGGKSLHRTHAAIDWPPDVHVRASLSQHGFAVVDADATTMTVRFVGVEPGGARELYCRRFARGRFDDRRRRAAACSEDDVS